MKTIIYNCDVCGHIIRDASHVHNITLTVDDDYTHTIETCDNCFLDTLHVWAKHINDTSLIRSVEGVR